MALRISHCVPAFALLLCAASALAQPAGTAWPMWGQNARHSFRAPFVGHDQPARYRWRHSLPGTAFKTGVTCGSFGQVIYTADEGTIHSVRHDGTLLWTHRLSFPTSSTPALSQDGLLVVASSGGCVHGIDELTGTSLWVYCSGGDGFLADPVIGDAGQIYLVSAGGSLYSLRPEGGLDWISDLGAATHRSTPSLLPDGSILVPTETPGRALVRVDPGGQIVDYGAVSDGGGVAASPAIDTDGRVFVATLSGSVEAIGLSPQSSWWNPLGGEFLRGLAVGADQVVAGSSDFNLYVLDKETGDLLWSRDLLGPIEAPPTIDDAGIIYAGATTGDIQSFYPDGTFKYRIGQGIFHGPITIGGDGTIYSTIDWSVWAKDEGAPGITLQTERTDYTFGDTLIVEARIYNDAPADAPIDLRVWIEAPDRAALASSRQYNRVVPGYSSVDEEILSLIFEPEHVAGSYSIVGAICTPTSAEPLHRRSTAVVLASDLAVPWDDQPDTPR